MRELAIRRNGKWKDLLEAATSSSAYSAANYTSDWGLNIMGRNVF